MTHSRKKELIYVALAFFTSLGQLTWVQMSYNEPSFVSSWTLKELLVVLGISSIFVMTQTLIAWKAYLSNPDSPGPTPEPTKP